MVARAVGLDGLGKFQPAQVQTKSGGYVFFFCLGHKTVQYAVVLRPNEVKPCLIARRDFVLDNSGNRDYSSSPKWYIISELPDMTGATSVPTTPVKEAQWKWWKQAAGWKGLLVTDEPPSAKEFQILPLLTHTNRKLS
jgi:hypothetical protein